ncbi:MAG: Na/Pi cotransporter family protein [Oscillospiraceae bacterium]|nr:Na/Pi cotransporter family protein [Oscillospiraceae bacterium]
MGLSNILALLSGVALFLFGMSLMGDGLKRVAGNKLEIILYRLSGTTFKGVLLGTGVTAVIQSSSATSVMAVGFVNSELMNLNQAVAVIQGSLLGTSITGWVVCLSALEGSGWVSILSTATITAVVAIVGIILRMFSKSASSKHVGDILMGFAVLMFGMMYMSSAVAPLRDNAAFIKILTSFSNPLLGVLAGAAFTAILQSASAAVGILQALSFTGVITFATAFPLILGIAVGASIPVLISSVGANVDGRRAAWSYLFIEAISAAVIGGLFYAFNAAKHFGIMSLTMTTFSIALLNTVFRAIGTVTFAPFTDRLCDLLRRIIKPSPGEQAMTADFDRLEERFLDHPALAVEQCRLTVNAMAEKTHENLTDSFMLLWNYSDAGYDKVEQVENAIDSYEDKLGTYLMKVTACDLTKSQTEDISKYLHTINDFERMSDHAMNIAECARTKAEKNMEFSPAGNAELNVLISAVAEVINLALNAFLYNDVGTAYRVEPLESVVDNLCDEIKLHHIQRLKDGKCTYEHGLVFNDLLTNFERLSDHCSNVALALIELQSDTFDAHEYINNLTVQHTTAFDGYFSEYSKKYKV